MSIRDADGYHSEPAGASWGVLTVAVSDRDGVVDAASAADTAYAMPDTTTLHVPFTRPQTLSDAAQVTIVLGYPVVGYGFQNREFVGEYWTRAAISIDNYVAEVQADYGTVPEVGYAIVEVPIDVARGGDREAARSRGSSGILSTSIEPVGATFNAPPIPAAKAAEIVAGWPTAPEDAQPLARGAAYESWAPEQADMKVVRSGSLIKFMEYYAWTGPTSTTSLNPDSGLEFEVNVRTTNPDFVDKPDRGAFAPFPPNCPVDYKDRPFAVNYGWASSALINVGAGTVTVSDDVEAYADYNDLFDKCEENSIAIGFKWPQKIPKAANGFQTLILNVFTPAGKDSTGPIGGVIQSVSKGACVGFIALTDCMGVAAGSDGIRTSLNADRNWVAPNKCWWSFGYGQDVPIVRSC